MLDDLRNSASASFDEEPEEVVQTAPPRFYQNARLRFLISLGLLLLALVAGVLILVNAGRMFP